MSNKIRNKLPDHQFTEGQNDIIINYIREHTNRLYAFGKRPQVWQAIAFELNVSKEFYTNKSINHI